MKYLLIMFTFILCTCLVSATLKGSGTNEDPYQLISCADLEEITLNQNANYIMINDIDCTDTQNWNDGKGFFRIGDINHPFNGVFDGQGHTVNGLYINNANFYSNGMFGYNTGIIKNFTMNNTYVSDDSTILLGGVTGYNNGTIEETNFYGEVDKTDKNNILTNNVITKILNLDTALTPMDDISIFGVNEGIIKNTGWSSVVNGKVFSNNIIDSTMEIVVEEPIDNQTNIIEDVLSFMRIKK